MKGFVIIGLSFCMCLAFVIAARAAYDKSETREIFTKSGYSVVDVVPKSNDNIFFVITQGTSGDCGALFSFPPIRLVHQFSKSDPLGCNPVSVAFFNGVVVSNFAAVATDNGSVIEYSEGGQVIATMSVPGAYNVAVQAGTPPTDSRTTSAATLYVLSNSGFTGTVYTIAVGSDGSLSAPSLIYTFPSNVTPTFTYPQSITVGPDNALYGVSDSGGNTQTQCAQAMDGCGFVFRLRPVTKKGNTTWTLDTLYVFQGGKDGNQPVGPLAFDANGDVYGATQLGGDLTSTTSARCTGPQFHTIYGCGVVYTLTKSGKFPWREKVLHAFRDAGDGAEPLGPVTLDASGNVFGTTVAGGDTTGPNCTSSVLGGRAAGCGVVFELQQPAGKAWQELVLYAFKGKKDGAQPTGPVTVDAADDVFGATWAGGDTVDCAAGNARGWAAGCGVLYQLSPNP